MSTINVDIYLNFDKRAVKKIEKALISEAAKEIFKQLRRNKGNIDKFVKNIVRKNLMDSPEVASMMDENGKLRLELGVSDANDDIIKVVEEIIDRIDVKMSRDNISTTDININVEILITGEYIDFYSKSYSSYVTKSGSKVEWLSWLLEAGNKDVVFGYRIKYGVGVGRTGDVIMLPSRSANWRVPPEFSGVATNNFITRSFDGVDAELLRYIGGILK